jgi:hypothetical protein
MPFKDHYTFLHLVEFTLAKPLKLGIRKMDDNVRIYAELNSAELAVLNQELSALQEAGKIKRFEILLCNLRDCQGALEDIRYETSKEE